MFQKILVPTHGLPKSIQQLHLTIELARINRGSIVVLPVASPRLYNGLDADVLKDGHGLKKQTASSLSI
jgi:nucleotide-binding universal stress UspA family protein